MRPPRASYLLLLLLRRGQIRELAQQTQPSPEALRAVFSKLAGDGERIAVLLTMLDAHPGVWSSVARSLLARVPVSLITKLICEALQVRGTGREEGLDKGGF